MSEEEARLERKIALLTQRVATLEAYVVDLRLDMGARVLHERQAQEIAKTQTANLAFALEREIAKREQFDRAIEEWTGQVEIDGTKHLLECIKRKDKTQACTCGAQPVGSFAAAEENDGDDDGH